MNLGEHFDYINLVVNRDQLGTPASPEQFNILLKKFNIETYNSEYQNLIKLSAGQTAIFREMFYESGALKRFESEEAFSYAVGSIPNFIGPAADFKRALTLEKVDQTGDNPVSRPVEILGPEEFQKRLSTVFRFKLSEKPIAREFPTKIQVIPMGQEFNLVYIRSVLEPYFDYCIDSEDQIAYMPVGSQIVGTDLILGAETLASGVTHPDSPSLPYSSTSVELDWDDEWQKIIIESIIAAVSKRSREGDMVQAAEAEKNKDV